MLHPSPSVPMRLHNAVIAAAIAALAPALGALPAGPPGEGRPTLFTNATFHLGDAQGTRATALLVEGGRIVELGGEHEFAERRLDGELEVVDLGGAFVVPGLQDAHCDVVALGRRLESVDLSGCADSAEIVERLTRAAEASEASGATPDAWLLAEGWEPAELPGTDTELFDALTVAFPERPVRILHAEDPIALANRRALLAAGIDAKGPAQPSGGRIVRDAEGRATGLLIGRAVDLLPTGAPSRERLERRILAAQARLLALGITAVHDMGVTRESEQVYRALAASGALRLRVVGYLDGERGLLPEWLARGPVEPDAKDRFCIRGVALDADGGLSTRTAALLDGYSTPPKYKASWLPNDSQLRDRIANAVAAGLQPAVRATGDRACRYVLDVYEELSLANPRSRELRPRLEGALVVSPKDWPRFPELGVLPSMQPVESTAGWIEARLRPDQLRSALAWRDVAPDIGRLAFGSRFPVRDPDPRAGLHAARVLAGRGRTGMGDSGSLRDLVNSRAALAGYTLGAAHAAHQSDRRGRLFEGYWADMTVFDRDPLEGSVEDLRAARVLATYVNGERVWAAE